jgi:hypothetical protein
VGSEPNDGTPAWEPEAELIHRSCYIRYYKGLLGFIQAILEDYLLYCMTAPGRLVTFPAAEEIPQNHRKNGSFPAGIFSLIT